MRSLIYYLWSTHFSDGLQHLILHLPVWPLSGLVGKADSPPIKFIPALWRVLHLPIVVFFLQGVYSNTLDFWVNLDVSTPFLRFPLRIFVSGVFGVGSKVVRELADNFRAI